MTFPTYISIAQLTELLQRPQRNCGELILEVKLLIQIHFFLRWFKLISKEKFDYYR